MTKKKSKPSWTTYEQEVFDLFKQHFPEANILKNVKVKGCYSKRKRQIDILIIETTPTGKLKTAIDTKFFKRKVDVKAVDSLAGFVEDVSAQKGMLITSVGYTKAALRRAYYGPHDLELDILNFSELHRFQGFTAIPYAGENSFIVSAPFGWVIDSTRSKGRIANMYQRGLDLKTAETQKEFLYINYWDRKRTPLTAKELDELQVDNMKLSSPVTVSHKPTVKRADAAIGFPITVSK